ncbi:hypothetical protein IMZ48_39610, partial [Candidatus Bathyarchaeota archaeon]|nr:hypothetical protein [Candidatus Bathyarchaeota archaeon]
PDAIPEGDDTSTAQNKEEETSKFTSDVVSRETSTSVTGGHQSESPKNEGEDKEVEIKSEEFTRHVFPIGNPPQNAYFVYEISSGIPSAGLARWVILDEKDNAQEHPEQQLKPFKIPDYRSKPSPPLCTQGIVCSYLTGPKGIRAPPGRTLYGVTISPDLVVAPYLNKKKFLAIDSSDFESFAFGVFGFASGDDIPILENTLKNTNDSFIGGTTYRDSLWFVQGMNLAGRTKENDGDLPNSGGSGGSGSDGITDGDGDSGGLSIGAQAGIGVGVSLVVIIICLVAFFLLRRRRRRGTTNAKSLIPGSDYADKESHAARVAESPHSPTSDDARESVAFVGAEAPAGRGSVVATPSSGNREVPHSVAHLVEEGMTEDQILRLEEEERALDQAIEQAGRGRR